MRLIKSLAPLCLLFASSFSMSQTGVTDREVRVGQFAVMSGPAAQLGQRLQAGIHGRTLKLVARDDGYEPEKAAAAVKSLIHEDKVFALLGAVGTPTRWARPASPL